ncbi:acyl carrier protein [Sciscionella sediminilitoris]|uniref:acyl carrier protein n=1 Tax=Sciscionella sediminilitoris TaxID=1445613 RepID=UPI0004DEDDCC|nr:acyl carrier protein [Sciscionella sp. SE31]
MNESTVLTESGMRIWLTERVAFHLERAPGQIAPDVPLIRYGLDSVYAMSVNGDIEQEFGLELDQTVLWDSPTIEALTRHILDRLRAPSRIG